MELGQKLADGIGAEVYAWGNGQVVKLFKPGVEQCIVLYEERVTRMAFAAGAPVPEVLGTVEVDGRAGIIFPRYDGQTLLNMVLSGAMSPPEAGRIMARLHYSIHGPRYAPALATFRQWTLFYLDKLHKKAIPADVLERVCEIVMELPEAGVLCHCDLHVGNILVTTDGPVAIDWISALNADPLVDVAQQHLMLTVIPIAVTGLKEKIIAAFRQVDASFIETYAELAGTSPGSLVSEIALHMTVMAAMRMLEPVCTEKERALLIEYIRQRGIGRVIQ